MALIFVFFVSVPGEKWLQEKYAGLPYDGL